MHDDLAILQKAVDKIAVNFKANEAAKQQEWDTCILVGEGLYEVKESIGKNWYAWISQRVDIPRYKANRYLGIYVTYLNNLIDYDEYNKMSNRAIDLALEKVKEQDHDNKKPIKPLDLENRFKTITTSVPLWLHSLMAKYCKMNSISQQDYIVSLIEHNLITESETNGGGGGAKEHDRTGVGKYQ